MWKDPFSLWMGPKLCSSGRSELSTSHTSDSLLSPGCRYTMSSCFKCLMPSLLQWWTAAWNWELRSTLSPLRCLCWSIFYHSHKEDTKIVPILQSYENGFPNGQAWRFLWSSGWTIPFVHTWRGCSCFSASEVNDLSFRTPLPMPSDFIYHFLPTTVFPVCSQYNALEKPVGPWVYLIIMFLTEL